MRLTPVGKSKTQQRASAAIAALVCMLLPVLASAGEAVPAPASELRFPASAHTIRMMAARASREPEWARLLLAGMHDGQVVVRIGCATVVGSQPELDSVASAALLGALGDAAPEVRLVAAWGLAGRADDARIAAILIEAGTTDRNDTMAIDGLGRAAAASEPALRTLIAIAEDPATSDEALPWALKAVAGQSIRTAAMTDLLLRRTGHASYRVRRVAVSSLASSIAEEPVRQRLAAMVVDEPHPDVRSAACDAWLDGAGPGALPVQALLAATRDRVASVRSAAVAALDTVRQDPAVATVLLGLAQHDPDPTVRQIASRVIGQPVETSTEATP
jgi:hypothetical protein